MEAMIARRWLAALAVVVVGLHVSGARAAETPGEVMRAIAIAQDERRWDDGVLRDALSHPDATVRARAVRAVGLLQDSTTVEALLPLVADPGLEVRREAVFALGQIGHRSAREALDRACFSPDLPTVQLAIEALGKLADKAATPRVVGFLGHPSAELRGEAAIALWRIADSTAVDALIARHDDPDAEVRWRVLYALERITDPDRIVLIAALHMRDDAWQTRAQAARTIGRQRSDRGTAYLVQAFEDPQPNVAVNALRAAREIADSVCTSCLPALVGALGNPHPYVRVTAATALGDRFPWIPASPEADSIAVAALEVHLGDPDAATRGASARALLAHRGIAALDSVLPMLADTSIYARAAAIRALGVLPAAAVSDTLRARLAAEMPLTDRMAAAEVLGTLRVREAVPALRAGLRDTSVLFAAAAASALGDMADSASVPQLAAAYGAHVHDPDPDARQSIRDALVGLAGQAFADSVEHAHPVPEAKRTYAPDFELAPAVRGAVLWTDAGEIEWAFETSEAPQTVRNFVRLAEQGYFDGTRFHRVVPNFVIQDGDPTGTGAGGPGYTIRCEYNRLRYDPGMVGMALAGKDTGGSQWFINHSPQHHLDGRYTIFARVVRGMDVVGRIVQGDRIQRIEILR